MAQSRLKSSFIYLANAVNDMRENWAMLAMLLAPLALAASLCLLPDAINLHYRLVETFEPGVHNVALEPAQVPYAPPRAVAEPPFPPWAIRAMHVLFALVTLVVNLVVLCALRHIQSAERAPDALAQAMAVYRESARLLPSFLWIALIQVFAIAIGLLLLVVPGLLVFIWLYFSQYALVFDNRRSWPALFFSRDVMRGQFFKVALRILVFLAVWSGFNSWGGATFVAASLLFGWIGLLTGLLWVAVYLVDLVALAIAYATTAFFIAAGVRLYRDLTAMAREEQGGLPADAALQPRAVSLGQSA